MIRMRVMCISCKFSYILRSYYLEEFSIMSKDFFSSEEKVRERVYKRVTEKNPNMTKTCFNRVIRRNTRMKFILDELEKIKTELSKYPKREKITYEQ